jgi:hypothetical protein
VAAISPIISLQRNGKNRFPASRFRLAIKERRKKKTVKILKNYDFCKYSRGEKYSLNLTFAGFASRCISETFPQRKFPALQYLK